MVRNIKTWTMKNYNELFRKMVAVLVGCVLCWLIGHLFASCSPGRHVTDSSHRTDTVYAVKTVRDTARVSDSVIVRVTAKGDTVYKTKEVWRERERVRWRVDTVYKAAVRTDTIRVPVAVERKTSPWERVVYKAANETWSFLKTLGLIGVLVVAVVLARRSLTRRKE
nr:MAG TPA: hypothetical protein [Caudoviricetes sp.]